MTQTTTIDGTSRTSVIPRADCEWMESAYLGEVGQGSFKIHDDAGSISVVGFKTIDTEQTACTSWPTLFMGFVGRKTFGRGTTYSTGAGREITVETKDGNDLLQRLKITGSDGDRTKQTGETVSSLLTWLIGSSYWPSSVADYGNVTYDTTLGLNGNDWRGSYVGDVLAACAKKGRFNYYVRWNYTNSGWEIVFRNDNSSTSDTSTITITNDGTADSVSSFAPFEDATLTEDPEHVYSGVQAGYSKGQVYRSPTTTAIGATTASAFVARDGQTDDSSIKTVALANDEGDTFLWESHLEEVALTLTIRMRAAYVNLLRAGQRVSVTLTHMATQGYNSATYFRVLRRKVTQPLDTDNDYDVTVDLSPQEAGPVAAGIVQTATLATIFGGGEASFPNAVTPGNLLVYLGIQRGHTQQGPKPPNTDIALPRWGAGAWTDATPSLTQVEWDDRSAPPAYQEGMKLYWKIADSTSASCWLDEYAVHACWEITGATMSGATIVSKTLQSSATTHAIGSLGTPAAGKIALLLLGLGANGSSVSLNPGVWIRDIHADAYLHQWNSDSNTVGFNTPAPPEAWMGHTTSTGAALAATLTDTIAHKWGGIAVLLA